MNNRTPSTAPPPRFHVPMLMRPWVLHTCHATTSRHLGVYNPLWDRDNDRKEKKKKMGLMHHYGTDYNASSPVA